MTPVTHVITATFKRVPVRPVRVSMHCPTCGEEMVFYRTDALQAHWHRCEACRVVFMAAKPYPCIEFEDVTGDWHDGNIETPTIGEYYLVKGIRENRAAMCQAWDNNKTGVWEWHELGEMGFRPHANTFWMSISE